MLLALSTATGIWLGDVGFRSLDDTYLMSWVVLLFRPPLRPLASSPGRSSALGTWFVVFVELVRSI